MVGGTQRRLAAIVLADVVGYSRLMGADETGTLEAMRAHRQELWDPTIERYGGRVVNRAGDSALIEFTSAVAAMECSVAIQTAMEERNKDIPEGKRVALRIGVNVGEVIVDAEEIYGDDVNIAARLQTLAKPDGIALSDNVYENIVNRLDLSLADAGEHEVKNIARPIHVWHWTLNARSVSRSARRSDDSAVSTDVPTESASRGKVAPAIRRLLDGIEQPTIAVLPFVNMSRNDELDYFCDGMTESLITDMSRSSRLTVASRNSSFQFKGRSGDAKDISEQLSVRYLIEGSVQLMGQRMRLNVQLIDARKDDHCWAERYDYSTDDLFTAQDELCDAIVLAVDTEIAAGDASSIRSGGTHDRKVRRLVMECAIYLGQNDEEGLLKCQETSDRVLEIEPTSTGALAMGSISRMRRVANGWAPQAETIADALRLVRQDECAPTIRHMIEGLAMLDTGDFEGAVDACRKGVSLSPNLANAHVQFARTLNAIGEFDEARSEAITGISLHPNIFAIFLMPLGLSLFMKERFDDAVAVFQKFRDLSAKDNRDCMFLAAALLATGDKDGANRLATEILDSFPTLTVREVLRPYPFKNSEHTELVQKSFAGLELYSD